MKKTAYVALVAVIGSMLVLPAGALAPSAGSGQGDAEFLMAEFLMAMDMYCEAPRVVIYNLFSRNGMAYLQELRANNVRED